MVEKGSELADQRSRSCKVNLPLVADEQRGPIKFATRRWKSSDRWAPILISLVNSGGKHIEKGLTQETLDIVNNNDAGRTLVAIGEHLVDGSDLLSRRKPNHRIR